MIHLVLGGARSGKSHFAELKATEMQAFQVGQKIRQVIYVATATVADHEMQQRITLHREARPQEWVLIEEPLHLSEVVKLHSAEDKVLLIECMTLWLSNWLCAGDKAGWATEKQAFLDALQVSSANIVVVSNEVGSGVVPLGELSRDFVDQAGWLNQALAALSDRASLVVAGYPVELKAL